MRIIAGKYKGRTLNTLEGMNTRPMMDRMKESVFNILGPYFEGQKVLDLFGGSGALSLEALSRGCIHSDIVDASKEAMNIIESNVNKLKAHELVSLFLMDYQQALKLLSKRQDSYDIIFLDPPYRLNIIDEILIYLVDHHMINDEAYVICQSQKQTYEPKEFTNEKGNLKLVKNYHYAISEITIYQYQKTIKE